MGKKTGMGDTTIGILLIIGTINLILGLSGRPGLLIIAFLALGAAIRNFIPIGEQSSGPALMADTDEETVVCDHCGTENLAIARACRACYRLLTKTQTQPVVTSD